MAFETLIDRYGAAMLRFARTLVRTPALADEVVQDAWLAALPGLDRFEGCSSLKTWLFRIVATTATAREACDFQPAVDDPCVAPDRFRGAGDQYPGGWLAFPPSWGPGERLAAAETRDVVARTIAALPPPQRAVISVRDVEHWSTDDVCNVLDVGETDQRVLLHRARSKVRTALEQYVAREPR